MRRRILSSLILATAISLTMPLSVQPALADETTQAEETTLSDAETEKAKETKSEDKKEETKPAKETEPETEAPKGTEPEKSTEPAEEISSDAYIMPVLTGYEFEDGSFDVWIKGTALYMGTGQLVMPTRITAVSYPGGELYSGIVTEKSFAYQNKELDAEHLDLKTVVVLPNGEYEPCDIKSQGSTLCLMEFNDAGLDLPVPKLSRDAWPDTVYMISYQGPAMTKIVKDIEAGEMIGQVKAVTIECSSDIYTSSEEQVGSVITNKSGEVIGMVTRHSTEKASVVRAGDIIKLIEAEPETTPAQSETPEYDDSTDKELLSAIEALEASMKDYKAMDLSGYSESDLADVKSAAEKAEASLRTATPDKAELASAKETLDASIKALQEKQPEEKKTGISTFKVVLLLIGVIAIFAVMIIIPIIVFKKPKAKGEDTNKGPSPLMQKLAKLLGVKLKDTPNTQDEDEAQNTEIKSPEKSKPEKKKEASKGKTGELKKDGYGGELARAMYEAEQKQSAKKTASAQTQGEERKEEQPKNVVVGSSGTSVLQKIIKEKKSEQTASAWLIDAAGKRIPITGTQFLLGKEQLAVDYCVADSTVSRKHCYIRASENGFVIEDNHSTNGTFVNGVQLTPGKPVKLTNHDTITISDIPFTFIDKDET